MSNQTTVKLNDQQRDMMAVIKGEPTFAETQLEIRINELEEENSRLRQQVKNLQDWHDSHL